MFSLNYIEYFCETLVLSTNVAQVNLDDYYVRRILRIKVCPNNDVTPSVWRRLTKMFCLNCTEYFVQTPISLHACSAADQDVPFEL